MVKVADLQCDMCDDLAIARYALSRGCVCKPEAREQNLCPQHIIRCTPLGSMELIEDYTVDQVVANGIFP